MKRPIWATFAVVAALFLSLGSTEAAIVTFDDAIPGATSYFFDGNSDGVADVVFTTTDPSGFGTTGPGSNQNYIQEPGLEGDSWVNFSYPPNGDLRVDFNFGASGSISFGYVLASGVSDPAYFASLNLYDSGGNLLGSGTQVAVFTVTPLGSSSFPEGFITVNFSGIASYGIIDLNSEGSHYIIDNFQGTFGYSKPVPEPSTMLLLGSGLAGLIGYGRRRLKK